MLFGLLFKRGVLSFRQNKISFADGSKDLKYSKDLIIVFNNYHLIIDFYIIKSTPTPSLTSGSLWLTANFRADFWPNLSYYWFEKKNLFRIVEKMNNFCFVINFLELLKKFFIQYLTADLHCSANLANKSATQEGAFRERLGYGFHEHVFCWVQEIF